MCFESGIKAPRDKQKLNDIERYSITQKRLGAGMALGLFSYHLKWTYQLACGTIVTRLFILGGVKKLKIAKIKTTGFLVFMLALLSLLLLMMKQSIFFLVPRTDFSDHMASMVVMIILTSIILMVSQKLKLNLSIFPTKFTAFYICATIIAGGLFVATPSNFTGEIETISLLVYTSIVTPIFEEIIFRGYVWNKLNQTFSKEWKTYIISTILFALWHFGYISSIAFRLQDGLLNAIDLPPEKQSNCS